MLAERLRREAASLDLVAVLSQERSADRRARYLSRRGWRTVSIEREQVMTCRGLTTKGNADMDLALEAGRLLSIRSYDILLVGTGDGDLAVAIARGVRRCWPRTKVYAVAFPFCVSARIRRSSGLFDGFIPLGRDLIRSGGF